MSNLYKEFVQLEAQIKYHDHLYSVVDKPIITNQEYDALVARYQEILEEHPEYKPNHIPGFIDQPDGFQTVDIVEPMISIVKKKDREEFVKWIKKNGGVAPVYEEKLDGVPVRLIYEFGELVGGHLRGSQTLKGILVSHRLKLVKNIPQTVPALKASSRTHIDGEVFCLYEDLEKYALHWDIDPKEIESRTTISGKLKRLKDHERDTLPMYFRVHGAGKDVRDLYKHWMDLRVDLVEWGFEVAEILSGTLLEELFSLKEKPNFGYAIDGIVVKNNDLSKWNDEHMVGYYTYCACYKFPTRCLETVLKGVSWGLTTQGALVGTLYYDPVEYDGTVLQRAKLNYASEYIKAGLSIGSIIQITKSNEIIPNMIGVKELGHGKRIEFPKTCPMCSQPIVKETEDLYCCVNPNCSGLIQKQLERIVSVRGLDIKGLGGKGIEQLIEAGFLSHPKDLFEIKLEDYLSIGIDQNRAEEIVEQVAAVAVLPLNRWLYASCIPEMGVVSALTLAQQYNVHFTELTSLFGMLKNSELMVELFGVDGMVMSEYVTRNEAELLHFFIHFDFENYLVPNDDKIVVAFSGTWILPREELRGKLEEHGYELSDRVTKKVTKLVIADKPSPGKITAAEKFGIPIIRVSKLTTINNLLTELAR